MSLPVRKKYTHFQGKNLYFVFFDFDLGKQLILLNNKELKFFVDVDCLGRKILAGISWITVVCIFYSTASDFASALGKST